jgi:hypothetical protein
MNANLMPSLFPGPQDLSDDDFNVVGGEIFATSSPWASWLSDGNPFAPTPTTGLPAVAGGSAGGQSDPGSVVAVTSGGIVINLLFDAAAMAAPASFRAGIQQAVAILAASISDKITVNLKIDYSGTGGGAAAGPDHGLFESYSSIRADLINGATPGDTTFNALTSGSSIQGQSNVVVWNAQLKLWGLMGANDTTTDDGSATFATDINPNLLVGVALHELTHAMGRIPYGVQPDVFDFFRFTSSGTRLFLGGATAPAAYFSLDGGNTKLADYGRTSDASDFLNSGVQGSNDPFNEFYNGATSQQLTATDLKQLDALGFHLVGPDTQAPTLVSDYPLSIQAGATLAVTSGLLSATDNISSAAQLHYTVTTAPARGTLLLSGAATSSFTQADINNGLVSYHETAGGVTSDTFSFKVTDSAGNTTNTAVFQINIDSSNHAPTDEILSGGVIPENSPNGTVVGVVTGVDHDPGAVLKYSLADDAGGRFAIDANTGQLKVADGLHLDYEAAGSYGIIVHAVDQGGLAIDKAFTIQLTDVPDLGLTGINDDAHGNLLLFRNDGTIGDWQLNGTQITGGGNVGTLDPTWRIAGTGDFNHDGNTDALLFNNNGTVGEWQLNGTQLTGGGNVGMLDPTWHVAGVGDFNHDGNSDVLLFNNKGTVGEWQLNGAQITGGGNVGVLDSTWHIAGTGDFNHDGNSDVLLFNNNGTVGEWLMNGTQVMGGGNVGMLDPTWHIAGTGDFNHDGNSDILLFNNNGTVGEWLMNGTQIIGGGNVGTLDPTWHIAGAGDFNHDGSSDILLFNNNGTVGEWLMNGTQIIGGGNVGQIDPTWHI